jgi:hypothetical protein
VSYRIIGSSDGLGQMGGCVSVPYTTAGGYPASTEICPSEPACGGPTAIREVLKGLGYQCADDPSQPQVLGTDCRPALFAFRADHGLPTEARGDPLPTDCPALVAAWVQHTTGHAPGATRKIAVKSPAASRVLVARSTPGSSAPSTPQTPQAPVPVVGFWEARSTTEKALIIGGGVAVVGALAFAFTR